MVIRKHLTTLTILSILATLAGRDALAARDVTGIRSMSMGGTLRAAAAGLAGPVLNPAGMSLSRMYTLGADYQYRASDKASQAHACVVDSITARVAAGINYTFARSTPEQTIALAGGGTLKLEETLDTHEVGLSLSMPLGKMLSLGLTGKYVNHKGELPEDAVDAGLSTPDISTITLDVGGVLRLGSMFMIGVVGQNLAEIDDINYPRNLGLGVAVQISKFLLEFDSALDFDSADEVKASFHGGAEAFFAGRYSFRAGVMYDQLRQASYVSGGIGLTSRKLAFEFGLRQMASGGAETLFGFALNLFLQSM